MEDFPFSIKEFYDEKEIVRALAIGARGGIRLSKRNGIIVLFFKAHTQKAKTDGGRNIYEDHFDTSTGFYYYTGSGQKGDQSFKNPRNRWLRDAKKEGRQIHLFRQYEEGGQHEYLGKFEVYDYVSNATQRDFQNQPRKVIRFRLKLNS